MSRERRVELIEAAGRYVGRGLPVFPCNGKTPLTEHGFHDASTDPEQVLTWWTHWPAANIGIPTGAISGVGVIDVDAQHGGMKTLTQLEAEHGKLPETVEVLTPGGGRHYWFQLNGDPFPSTAGKLGVGIDTRGEGGYVIVPPSIGDNGRFYKFMRDSLELAELPSFSANAAKRTNGTAPKIGDTIPSGARDTTLASLAGSMRRRGMEEAEIVAALTVANETRCKPPLPAGDVERIARSIAKLPASDPAGASAAEPFEFVAVDWPLVVEHGVPELEYVSEPYLPARKRIWGVGAAEAGKSIWAAYKACELTRVGHGVVYVSQENGLEEELRRFLRLQPDFTRLRLYVDQGLDLALPEHVAALIEASEGAALTVIDTLSACWSGDEDSNAAVTGFDRDVLLPLVRETGASPLVLDHTGNPQPFVRRKGVSAPRGASAKGQKADFLLEFRASGDSEFTIDHGKARGTRKQPPRTFRVVDTDDNKLDLLEIENDSSIKAAELADKLIDVISQAGEIGTKALRRAAKELGAGVELQTDAMALLETEDPPRATVGWEVVETGQGRQRTKLWRPALSKAA
jgi:Bifunctional DNA primase/polymerase, N-terminal/AAA domain/Primase C terminal 1 (PriCT-1)